MNDFDNANHGFANDNHTYEGVIERILLDDESMVRESELLSFLLGGRNDTSSTELVKRLLEKCRGGVYALCRAENDDLLEVDGMNTEILAKIRAIGTLSSFIGSCYTARTSNMDNCYTIREMLYPKLRFKKRVEYYAVFMNYRYELIKYVKISQGGYTKAAIDNRLILREALLCNAYAITLVHNQPEGVLEPSEGDVEQTLALRDACETIDVVLHDHLVLDDGLPLYSYRLNGKL